MSTYDGAYGRGSGNVANICSCEEEVNMFCYYHGKFGKGGYKGSKEQLEAIKKVAEENLKFEIEKYYESYWGY